MFSHPYMPTSERWVKHFAWQGTLLTTADCRRYKRADILQTEFSIWFLAWRLPSLIQVSLQFKLVPEAEIDIGPHLFGRSAVVWYVMCLDSLNWTLLVRFHGRYWHQSFIDGSNIWGVDRTDPWGPEMDHPPFGSSDLVVVSLYDMSCVLILLTRLYGWDSTADIVLNPSSMGPIFGAWIGPTLRVPKWTIRHWAAAIWL